MKSMKIRGYGCTVLNSNAFTEAVCSSVSVLSSSKIYSEQTQSLLYFMYVQNLTLCRLINACPDPWSNIQ